MDPRPDTRTAPRRVEVLAGLSVAIDLGLGQPTEHVLRAAVIACRLAEHLGLDREQQATVYYSTLVMWIGCHADSPEYARWFGDDIAVRQEAALIDWAGLPYLTFLLGNVAKGEPLPRRVRTLGTLLRDARGQLAVMVHSHCRSAALLARHIGLSPAVEEAMACTFERYDGGGLPAGVSGDAIPIEMRVAQVADMVEIHERTYGLDGAVDMARARRGGQFDPDVVDALLADPDAILAPCAQGDAWQDALGRAPDAQIHLDPTELDELTRALGDFADLKCPLALGHSRGVADLAARAAECMGDTAGVPTLRRAGYLHDLGRLGVSNQVWSKTGPLTETDWERLRMHPYLTERVLRRIPGLSIESAIARAHHEHLDGSGYPLGLTAAMLDRRERLLAVAVAYQSAREPRPYREALDPIEAAARLRRRSASGALDPECVDAVLAAAGHRTARVHRNDLLTRRECEVLGLVARGLSNREIADRLVLSEKTVRNHVERTYTKIGVGNRVGASLYALEHGLATPAAGNDEGALGSARPER